MTNPANYKTTASKAIADMLAQYDTTLRGTLEVDRLDAFGIVDNYGANGGYDYVDVNGTKTKVLTKYFTGTVPDLTAFSVAHGCTLANIRDFNVVVGGRLVDGVVISSAIAGTTYVTTVPQVSLKGETYNIAVHFVL